MDFPDCQYVQAFASARKQYLEQSFVTKTMGRIFAAALRGDDMVTIRVPDIHRVTWETDIAGRLANSGYIVEAPPYSRMVNVRFVPNKVKAAKSY